MTLEFAILQLTYRSGSTHNIVYYIASTGLWIRYARIFYIICMYLLFRLLVTPTNTMERTNALLI
jgi:hypothetical protein